MIGRAASILLALSVAATPQDDVDRVAAALHAGATGGAAARRAAAATLQATGARPLDGDVDLVRRWHAPAAPAWRDRALGPGYRAITLSPGGTLRLDQTFLAGRRARVVAVTTIPAAFTLVVSDVDARMPCPATRTGRACDWVPDHTARFGIDLANRSPRAADFFLVLQ